MTAAPVRRAARPAMSPTVRRNHREGFILVAVLWILGALAGLVGVHAVYVADTAAAAALRNDDLAADSLAVAAVELAAYRVVSVPAAQRPRAGDVSFRAGAVQVTAVFQNETARIDLNAAPRELLAGLFTALGAEPETADAHARRIVEWRSPSSARPGDTAYRDTGPRAGPFVQVEELFAVDGVPEALAAAAMPYLTIYSARPEVDVREGDPVVRAALDLSSGGPGGSAVTTGLEGTAPAREPAAAPEPSDAVRISVRMDFGAGRIREAEAVILVRDFGDAPYRVLSWRAAADQPAPMEARR